MSAPRIMVVEDDPVISLILRDRLKKLKYEVTSVASSGDEALEQAATGRPDLVLMDIKLEGKMDGIETAGRLKDLYGLSVIYVSAYTDDALLDRAKHTEPLGYLVKPYGERELRSAIEMALYKGRMEKLLREGENRFRTLTETAPYGISVMASDRTFEYFNPKFTEIFGWTKPLRGGLKLATT